MARDAIYRLLTDDTELSALGGTGFVVVANFSGDQRPNDLGVFIVIRWGTDDFDRGLAGPHHFDLWVHLPVAVSTDYGRIDAIIDRADAIFDAANDTATTGADGWVLHGVDPQGRSGDFEDPGYQTICRRASYRAYTSRP